MIDKEIKRLSVNMGCSVKEFNWERISCYQSLSEDFIREFKDKVEWGRISRYQSLSEDFIREFKDRVAWGRISCDQSLSEDFIREFKDRVDIKIYNDVHRKTTLDIKKREVIEYAKSNNLSYDDDYLYAFRIHNNNGSGMFNQTIKYKKGVYYRDWHCDMRRDEENSFGLGIYPKNKDVNIKVRVKIEDWGVAVDRDDGKARVWGFEII